LKRKLIDLLNKQQSRDLFDNPMKWERELHHTKHVYS